MLPTTIIQDDPDLLTNVHKQYLHAGADIITCASSQMTAPVLMKAMKLPKEKADKLAKELTIESANIAL